MRIPHKLAPTAALPPTYAVLERKKAPPQNKIVLRRGLVCPGGENTPKGRLRRAEDRKKVLSLVLCVAMMLSVMVMGAGAAFTDQDKIVNEEAVDMISALGIVDGYEDDSFQPEKNIERGEAAKMIAVMLNGGKDAVQDTSVSSFNDVLGSADAWANKYIEYGVSKAILAGVGDNRFAPASNVTGTQLAKMLLVSLGYDADKEGYLDDTSWAVNVNTDAASVGLYAGVESVDMNAALTRDNAAQMIWNALQAETVRYNLAGQAVKTGDTLLETAFGADYGLYSGILTDISYNKDTKVYTYKVEECDSSANIIGWWHNDTFETTADYTDLFAMNVKVLHDGDDALCIRTDKGGTVVEGVIGDITGIDNDHFNSFKVNGNKYLLDNVAKNPWDFADITVAYNNWHMPTHYAELGNFVDHQDDTNDDIKNTSDEALDIFNQYAFRAIDLDGGGDVDVIVVYPYLVLRTDTVTDDTFNTNIITTSDANMTVDRPEQDRYITAGDRALEGMLGLRDSNWNTVEVGDDASVEGTVTNNGYVMAIPGEFTATGEDHYKVLEIKSAAATVLDEANQMITLAGTSYNGENLVAEKSKGGEEFERFSPINYDRISLGKTYNYVEVNGYLFILDGNSPAPEYEQYAVATKVAMFSSGADKVWETDLLFADGTTKRVNVVKTDNVVNDENLDLLKDILNGGGFFDDILEEGIGGFIDAVLASGQYGEQFLPAPIRGSLYSVEVNDDGYYELTAVNNDMYPDIFYGDDDNVTTYPESNFDVQQAYVPGATLTKHNYWLPIPNAFMGAEWYNGLTPVGNTSICRADGDNLYFNLATYTEFNPDGEWGWAYSRNTTQKMYMADDARIFVYNAADDTYKVVNASDLSAADIDSWAFTGATEKNGVVTVDLGYVTVNNDPTVTTEYAVVTKDATVVYNDANGTCKLVVEVMTPDGPKTLETSETLKQYKDAYIAMADTMKDGYIFEMTLDQDSKLIDVTPIKEVTEGLITAVDGKKISIDNEIYFLTDDTEYINDGIALDKLAPNARVSYLYDTDKNLTLLVAGEWVTQPE